MINSKNIINNFLLFIDFYGKITEYKLKGVKVIIGIGGIEDSIDFKWSQVIADPERRKTFIKSILKFLHQWKFDGVQIAWQYPVCKEVTMRILRIGLSLV